MEASTPSIVSALGAGSGIDMSALARNLAEAQYAARIERLSAQGDALERKVSLAGELKNQISGLASALGDRVRTGDLAPTPSISNASVASVTRATGARPAGSYTLEVTTLAKAQTLAGPSYADSSSTTGSGTLTLRFGTVSGGTFTADADRDPVDITIASGATLAQVATAINAAGTGVTAYVANAATGARLVLKGAEGAENGFVLEATETVGDEGLADLAWEPASGNPAQLLVESADAAFKLDGVAMQSPTNKVGQVAPGLSLTLTGTNAGNPATIRFNDASAAVSTVMQDLKGALNEIVAALNEAMDPETGELARDDGARALRRSLSSLGTTTIMPSALDGEPKTLADLGLAVQRDGTFRIDTARLEATLARDPEGAAAMFTNGLYGVYSTIDKISRSASLTGNPGSLAGSVSRYNGQIRQIDEQSAKIAEQQESLRARLARQLTSADSRIGASQSTLSFLKAQIALWNRDDN
jgi:flagellar hook-associated protein 2